MHQKISIRITSVISAIVFLYLAYSIHAQPSDSLNQSFTKQNKTLENLLENTNKLISSNPDSALILGQQAYVMAVRKNDTSMIIRALNCIATVHLKSDEFVKSADLHSQALDLCRKKKDTAGIAYQLNQLGIGYKNQGRYEKALAHILESAALYEALNDEGGMSEAYNGIGMIYKHQMKYEKALEYYLQSMEIRERDSSALLANAYGNIGVLYKFTKDYKKALSFLSKALSAYQENDIQWGVALANSYIGSVYHLKGNLTKAKEHYSIAEKIQQENDEKYGLAYTLLSLGELCYDLDDALTARAYFNRSLTIASGIGVIDLMMENYQALALSYAMTRDYEKAYEYHLLFSDWKDSLFNKENSMKMNDMEAKYQNEKKELEIENLKKIQVLKEAEKKAELAKRDEEMKRINTQRLAFAGGMICMILIAILIFRSYRRKRKDNQLISEQKRRVELQHKEINDSLNYAKKIQTALLTEDSEWSKISSDYFVLFKPKEVVSGDFFWAYHNADENLSVWVAADCTGHGVPGAFMSMLGIGFLNDIVAEAGYTKPEEILNKLREKIIMALIQKNVDTQQKDGMDLAICVWNRNKRILSYSGANNPLWLIRKTELLTADQLKDTRTIHDEKGLWSLVDFRPDKMPVGIYIAAQKSFTSVDIELVDGDIIYTFTDGYADQFGGTEPGGKKFKYKPLKKLLLAGCEGKMADQKQLLDQEFELWKGSLEQIDDVCVIGVRTLL